MQIKMRYHPAITLGHAAADHFKIDYIEIISLRRDKLACRARHIAMYLCKALTGASLPMIGRHFGDRDHTTVINAIQRVELRLELEREGRRSGVEVRDVLKLYRKRRGKIDRRLNWIEDDLEAIKERALEADPMLCVLSRPASERPNPLSQGA